MMLAMFTMLVGGAFAVTLAAIAFLVIYMMVMAIGKTFRFMGRLTCGEWPGDIPVGDVRGLQCLVRRCRQWSPHGSRFCRRCGNRLPCGQDPELHV